MTAIIEDTLSEFRAAFATPQRLPLESFLQQRDLTGLSEAERRQLTVALLQLEVDLSRKAGRELDAADYARRFPEFSNEFIQDLISLPTLPKTSGGSLLPARYQLKEQIGAGGLGAVWRVFDRQLHRTMAVKMLRSTRAGERESNERLLREAMLTGGLQHPGVPPVYDSGKLLSGGDFFSMKLVDGKTLAEILKSGSPTTTFLLGVFEQIAQTIAYAHAQGVIHRDLKPQNIMVGEFGEVQVMDWGMAKKMSDPPSNTVVVPNRPAGDRASLTDTSVSSLDSSIRPPDHAATRIGDVVGTPAYMSPEQARGENDRVSQSSDVFALGAILFEILSQEQLYDAEGVEEALAMARGAEYGSVHERLGSREVDAALIDVCTACLTHAAEDRPSAVSVADSIAEYQAQVQQRLKQAELDRKAALIQSREQKKRERVFTWMLAAVLLVSLLGTAGIAWQWQKAVAAAKQANLEAETRRDVNNFLIIDMLRLADPGVEPDRDLKLRTVLDRAAERISERFGNRPEVEAEIRLQIGRSYVGVGEFQAALEHFERSARINREMFGEESDEYWTVLEEIAETEHELGNYQAALEQWRQIETRKSIRYGAHSAPAAIARSSAAVSLMMTGDYQAAAELQREVVADLESAPSNNEVRLNHQRARLAHLEFQLANIGAAQELLDQALPSMEQRAREATGGTRLATDYIQALCTQGSIHDAKHEFAAAEQVHRDVVALSTELMGADHPRRLMFVNFLVVSLLKQNKIDEARQLLDEVLPVMEESIGVDHEITLAALNSLAGLYMQTQNYESAEGTLLKIYTAFEQKFDSPHPAMVNKANNLAGLYLFMDRLEDAETWMLTAADLGNATLGPDHPDTIKALADLALVYRRQGKLGEAESTYLEALERANRALPPNDPDTLLYSRGLSWIYEHSDRHAEAESLLRAIVAGYDERFGPGYETTFDLTRRLAVVLSKQGRTGEAIPMLEDVLSHYREARGENDSETLSVISELISAEEQAGDFDAAQSRLERLMKIVDPDSDGWLYLQLESRMGSVLVELGDYDTAESTLLFTFEQQQDVQAVSESARNRGLRATAERLIVLYEVLGDTENVALWRLELEALKLNEDKP